MESNNGIDIVRLIKRGGVYNDVEGDDLETVYENALNLIELPGDLDKEEVLNGLVAREHMLSTAVGGGIAIPHFSSNLIKNVEEQLIAVVYLKHPIQMQTPDLKPVTTLFIILTMNSYYHMKVLDTLTGLLRNIHFRNAINNQVNGPVLTTIINGL